MMWNCARVVIAVWTETGEPYDLGDSEVLETADESKIPATISGVTFQVRYDEDAAKWTAHFEDYFTTSQSTLHEVISDLVLFIHTDDEVCGADVYSVRQYR